MKREKVSPTIESFKRPVAKELGKKATAALLTGSMFAFLSACKEEGDNYPVAHETSISSSTPEQAAPEYPLGGKFEKQSYPEETAELKEITDIFGSLEKYPLPGDYTFTYPGTDEVMTLENVTEDTVMELYYGENSGEVSIDVPMTYSYIPQIDKYLDRESIIEVNGTEYDTDKIMNEPAYLSALLDFKTYEKGGMSNQEAIKHANNIHAEAMIALGLSYGDIVNEYRKGDLVTLYDTDIDSLGEKKYKKLGPDATNEEILANYDIETGILTSMKGLSNTTLSSASFKSVSNEFSIDSEINNVVNILGQSSPIFNDHREIIGLTETQNLSRKYIVSEKPGMEHLLHARIINATNEKNGSDTPEQLAFVYYDFGDVQKWVNVGDSQYTESRWSSEKDKYEKESYVNEILSQ